MAGKVNLSFDTVAQRPDPVHRWRGPGTTPFVLDTLIGFNHTDRGAGPDLRAATATSFSSWSDGGARTHTITVPTTRLSHTASYAIAVGAVGLVGAWGFNESSGTTAADASGNGNTATLAKRTHTGRREARQGLSFDGVNDYLSVPELERRWISRAAP